MQNKELQALINLLDDDNFEIYNIVREKLIRNGSEAVSILKQTRKNSSNELLIGRIDEICDVINYKSIKKELKIWSKNEDNELMQGVFLVTKLQYPNLKKEKIDKKIKEISNDIQNKIQEYHKPLDCVRIINDTLYDIFKFSGNVSNFFAVKNSYINDVLETKKGSHIIMTILYRAISLNLGLPIFPVDFPGNMLMAYQMNYNVSKPSQKNVLFYINPFNSGVIAMKYQIYRFLKKNKIIPKKHYFVPANHNKIVKVLIRFLIRSHTYAGDDLQIKRLEKIIKVVKKQKK